MKNLIIATIAILFVTVANAQTRNSVKTIADGQKELIVKDSANTNVKYKKPITDYQFVIIPKTKMLKVYDGVRFVGQCDADRIFDLIEADGVNDNTHTVVSSTISIKSSINIIDGNKQ